MLKVVTLTLGVAALLFTSSTDADARRYRGQKHYASGAQYISHPAGCPRRAFCGCGASVRVFGKSVRSLWLARAWYKFPRTSPASGMVAVRPGHVFVLESHAGGNSWVVTDYNSGRGLSRRHVRSIAGYTIVNPHGGRYASLR